MSLEFVLLSTLLFLLLATGGRRLALVKLCDDGLRNVLKLLLLRVVVLRVGFGVVLKPLDCSINSSLHLFLLFIGELASKLLLIINLVLEPIGIRFKTISGFNLFWSLVMVIFSRLPVALSSADTCRIPLAS